MEERVHNGQTYRRSGPGQPWVRVGGQSAPQRVQTKPADPTIGDQRTISRNKAEASQYDPAKAALDNEASRLAIQLKQQEIAAAEADAARKAKGDKDTDARNQRIGLLNALADQLVEVEKLYNTNFRGGAPNWLAGRVQPAEADELNKAASGLLDAGQTAFRIPGSGDQNPQELKFKLDAYLPSPTGTDKGNTQNFNYLRRRVNAELKSLGQPEIDFDQRITPNEERQDSILNPAFGRPATNSETSALGKGQRFAYDEQGKPIGIINADGSWDSGYSEIVGGNRDERDDATRDTVGGAIDAGARGLVDWPTLGNSEKIAAAGGALFNRRDGEGFGDAYSRNMDIQNRTNAADERVNPWARLAGQFGGSVLTGMAARGLPKLLGGGDIPAFSGRAMGLDAATGSAYGASKALDKGESPLSGATAGGIYSVMGGIGGRGAANVVGRGLSGVTNPDVRRLYDAGVPMTLPQMVSQSGTGMLPFGAKAGEVLKGFEDVAEGLGPLGAGVRQARMEGVEGFDRAAFREGGFDVPNIAEQGIGQARGVRSQAYADALDGRNVTADLPFVQNVNDIVKRADGIKGMEGVFRDTLSDRVGGQFDKGTRTMTGRGLQAAIRGLKSDARKADANPAYMRADQFGNAARDTEAELLSLANRQNPGMAEAYKDANKLNLNLGVLKKAVSAGKSTGGMFTPAQLGAAADQAAEKFGGNGGTAARPFFELQRAAQNVLPSKIPDSGTAGRSLTAALPYLVGIGSQSGAVPGLDTGSAEANTLTALALLTTKNGRKLAEKALLARPKAVRDAGKSVRRRSGLFGAAVAPLPVITQE